MPGHDFCSELELLGEDPFFQGLAGIDPADEEKMAIMARFKAGAMAAMGNLPKLVEAR